MHWILFSVIFYSSKVICSDLKKTQEPEQVHIAFGSDPTQTIAITWSTNEPTPESAVLYGKNDLSIKAVGTSREFVDAGPEKRVRYIHRVKLLDLEPGASYLYKCGSNVGWSKTFSFRTANSSEDWSPRVAVFGDLGVANARILPFLKNDVEKKLYDAVIHVGDFGYDLEENNGELGDEFMRLIEPVAANVSYMVCPGNHEQAYNFSHYKERFTMPGDTENLYYSFDLGPAHFISIDSEAYYYLNYGKSLLINQYEWLVNDLKEANKPENRQKRPWIIVYGHKPMYCSNVWMDDCAFKTAKVRVGLPGKKWYEYGLEELFYNAGVDLEFWGHQHSYERLWPVYDYQVKNGSTENPNTNPKGPIQITTGVAGSKYNVTVFKEFKPEWSAVRSVEYGYSILEIHNRTHIHFQHLSVDKGGEVIDETWIIKDHHEPYKRF
uniref:Purple acid phosphatase n=1 Tax=Riptortus pedestris TaxID=329032 RepID=R4WIN4_RIPPE|nr:purple acid phosphatase, putative [Riptortus pedestris]